MANNQCCAVYVDTTASLRDRAVTASGALRAPGAEEGEVPRIVQVEVPSAGGAHYYNALLYVDPRQRKGFYVPFGDEDGVLGRIPWNHLAARMFPPKGEDDDAGAFDVQSLLRDPEDDPFVPLIYLHACLLRDPTKVDTIKSLEALRAPPQDGKPRTLLGARMYELYAVDSLLPSGCLDKERAVRKKRRREDFSAPTAQHLLVPLKP